MALAASVIDAGTVKMADGESVADAVSVMESSVSEIWLTGWVLSGLLLRQAKPRGLGSAAVSRGSAAPSVPLIAARFVPTALMNPSATSPTYRDVV